MEGIFWEERGVDARKTRLGDGEVFPRLHTRVKKGQKCPDPLPESPTNQERMVCLPKKSHGSAQNHIRAFFPLL